MNDFDKVSKDPLDEWVKFLKTGKIDADATAAGLPEARECLRVDSLSAEDKQAYIRHMEAVRHMRSLFDTSRDEGYEEGRAEGLEKGLAEGLEKELAEGRAEGRAEGELSKAISIARNLKSLGLSIDKIKASTGLSEEELKDL